MAVKPKLAMIPDGVKAGKLYSILPSDGTGDFDFSRSGSATRINKDGLIEMVDADVPRLNYPLIDGVVSGCPSLLLENSATNLLTYSEELSNWSNIQFVTVTDNQIISPDGTLNASKINETVDNSVHRLFLNPTVASAKHTYSVFVKKGTRSWIYLRLDGASNEQRTWFDIENGVIGTINSDHNASIEDYGNGWYRCAVSIKGTTYDTTPLAILAITKGNDVQNYAGNVNEYIYAWGAMLEQSSFPTSYIPSLTGSQTTRSAETCNNAGDVNTFNDSEGVLMAEISALNNTVDGYTTINVGSNSVDNRLGFGFDDQSRIYGFKRTNTSWNISIEANINEFNKVAISYDTNNNHFWLNGFKVDSNTTIGDISQPIELDFRASYGGEQFNGSTKQLQYFDTALTDTDLEELTSWASFNEMARDLLYTIL